MTDTVARIPAPSAVDPVAVPPPVDAARNDNVELGRYRLTIEAVGPNRYVYKVLDSVTGEVIRQLPRENVEQLMSDPTYRGGKVVSTAV